MTKQLKCYYLLLIRYYKLSLLNQFLEGYSIMAAWGNNFLKKNFFLLFFHFSALLKCHWPIWASSLKSHSPASRIYSPLATGRVLMKRLLFLELGPRVHWSHDELWAGALCSMGDHSGESGRSKNQTQREGSYLPRNLGSRGKRRGHPTNEKGVLPSGSLPSTSAPAAINTFPQSTWPLRTAVYSAPVSPAENFSLQCSHSPSIVQNQTFTAQSSEHLE